MKCPNCGSRDIDFQEAGGQSICVNCGTVLEENTIVSSIEFQESGDRSNVVGQFVSASCSKPYMSGGRGMGRHGDSRDSRDVTLVNARRSITQVASSLRLPPLYIDRAYRLYQLALQRNFIFGRRQTHVVATCLYIICRQEKSPHLLIDFSDALQVNVYVLGKSFLQFSKVLNLNLPVVDPSLYIHRYATRLDLGDKMGSVITTSLRVVTRLKKDWIATGRRPDGICAVAMFIASRAYGFNISHAVISKIFRISSDTLKKRLEEFKATPSAQLSLVQFNVHDLEVEFDPPCFIRNLVNSVEDPTSISLDLAPATAVAAPKDDDWEGTLLGADLEGDVVYQVGGDDSEDNEEEEEKGSKLNTRQQQAQLDITERCPVENGFQRTRIGTVDIIVPVPGHKSTVSTSIETKERLARRALYSSIYSEVARCSASNSEAASRSAEADADRLGALRQEEAQTNNRRTTSAAIKRQRPKFENGVTVISLALSADPNKRRQTKKSSRIPSTEASVAVELNGAGVMNATQSEEAKGHDKEDKIGDEEKQVTGMVIDDVDLDAYILTQDEQAKRSAIWEKTFRPFMDEREKRRQLRDRDATSSTNDRDKYTANGKLRRKYAKRSLADPNSTTSEAILATGVAAKGSSKKINYDALMGIFKRDGGFAAPEVAVSSSSSSVAPKDQGTARTISFPSRPVTIAGSKVLGLTNDSRKAANVVTFDPEAITLKKDAAKVVAAVVEDDEDEEDNLMYEDGDGGGDNDYDGYDDEYY